MQKNPRIGLLTCVYAGLLFYSNIEPLFDEIGDSSIAIVLKMEKWGIESIWMNGLIVTLPVILLCIQDAGIAPWNYAQYHSVHDTDGNVTVDGASLIFYHFHQFQLFENGSDRLPSFYTSECPEPVAVYERYEEELREYLSIVRAVDPSFSGGMKPVSRMICRHSVQKFVPMWAKDSARRFLCC
ncbi:hypothetical protein [Haematospirillum sp. H1815]|uniref:hypothetical protein n=1 Tax=Haematospirillum sp. H1815 TaxID=2723108 RepID=UPI001ADE93FD|nr:hypothetical protein [Haematospirillum sp. H1815]